MSYELLQIDWQPKPLYNALLLATNENAIVTNPSTSYRRSWAYPTKNCTRIPTIGLYRPSVLRIRSAVIHKEINWHLLVVEPDLNRIIEANAVRQTILDQAQKELEAKIKYLRNEIARVEPTEVLLPMEWKPMQPMTFTNWKSFREQCATAEIYTRADSGIPLTILATPGCSTATRS